MKEYYLAKCLESGKYLIRQENDEGLDPVVASYFKWEIAKNSCRELNERAASKEEAAG